MSKFLVTIEVEAETYEEAIEKVIDARKVVVLPLPQKETNPPCTFDLIDSNDSKEPVDLYTFTLWRKHGRRVKDQIKYILNCYDKDPGRVYEAVRCS